MIISVCVGCGGEVADVCEISEYEKETHYRCTPKGELQVLECSEWNTIIICNEDQRCSPGGGPRILGCRDRMKPR